MKLAPLDSAHTKLSIHAKNSIFMKYPEWSLFSEQVTYALISHLLSGYVFVNHNLSALIFDQNRPKMQLFIPGGGGGGGGGTDI